MFKCVNCHMNCKDVLCRVDILNTYSAKQHCSYFIFLLNLFTILFFNKMRLPGLTIYSCFFLLSKVNISQPSCVYPIPQILYKFQNLSFCAEMCQKTKCPGKRIKNITERSFNFWGKGMICLIMLPNFKKKNILTWKIKQINNPILHFLSRNFAYI